ncbi:MAG TPA: M28 family metallopeptidase [Sphingomicrobium sp.]|nr:M28 family metallopeptidase [Sphingomicrobium sp.]
MMKRGLLAVAMAAVALVACGQSDGGSEPQFSGDRIKSDVAFLADDKLEGRFTGTPGHETAARFVAARFAALGLKPGNHGSWYQQIPFAQAERKGGAPSGVTIAGQHFANGVDVSLYPNSAFPDQKIDGDVVFVGYGLAAPEIGSNDYDGLDVRGKIVVALWGYPKGAPSEVGAHLLSEKPKMAKDHGALALLQVTTPVLDSIATWESIAGRADQKDVKWVGADGRPNYPGPNLPLTGYLGPKAAAKLFAGAPASLSSLLAATQQDGARPKGFALKQKIQLERHSLAKRIQSPNVIAILPGSDPKLRDEYIVLSAHLDHIGRVKPENGDSIANGAMDNAMGVATMLEAARAFVESGTVPKRSIMFVALTGEEEGLLGSEYLAMHPVTAPGKVVGAVNLDMPIVTYDFQDMVAYGADHSTVGKAVAKAIASQGIKLTPDPAPEEVSFVRSDHYSFVKAGVPAVSLDLGPGGAGAKATEHFLANHYHRVSDDMKLPFNWGAAAKFALVNYLIARELADAKDPPRWYKGDYFGDRFAKDAAKADR